MRWARLKVAVRSPVKSAARPFRGTSKKASLGKIKNHLVGDIIRPLHSGERCEIGGGRARVTGGRKLEQRSRESAGQGPVFGRIGRKGGRWGLA